jgi:tetratricopeptide (TPR) repeat protein
MNYFLRYAEEVREADTRHEAYALMAREHDNLRLALEEARELGADETLMRLAAALTGFWWVRGFFREASGWLAVALERASSPPLARMEVLRLAGSLARHERDFARAEALVGEWRRAAEQAGDDQQVRLAMSQAAGHAEAKGDLDRARAGYLAVQALADEAGDRDMHAAMEVNLGVLGLRAGDFGSALRHSVAAAEIFREMGDESGLTVSLQNCGWSAFGLGDHQRAEESFREALAVAGSMGWVFMIAILALGLGGVSVARGEAERGVRLLGAADSLRAALETGFNDAVEEEVHERAVADAKAALGDEAFAAAWARGQGMTPDEVVEICAA